MARVAATASLGVKKSVEHKKEWGKYDSMSPHHSITLELTLPDDSTDEQLVERAENLHTQARALVEKKIARDLKDMQRRD